jgi:hypothetical protein
VALVRDTELPPALVSVHDLRGSFFSEARRLVGVIWGQVPPRRRRVDVPTTVPPDPVLPARLGFPDLLWPLMLAVGYFWAVNA